MERLQTPLKKKMMGDKSSKGHQTREQFCIGLKKFDIIGGSQLIEKPHNNTISTLNGLGRVSWVIDLKNPIENYAFKSEGAKEGSGQQWRPGFLKSTLRSDFMEEECHQANTRQYSLLAFMDVTGDGLMEMSAMQSLTTLFGLKFVSLTQPVISDNQ
ncbi:hypothetical protein RF11_05950 [Thelohanellus kitauei]|uniref:Uncharacterized protein n=1 Tax=Thelohanellus kitauei TaxID=669202 RepID=A0A0C2II00_THEKT|nr:hypothetical protein RF11_05950 [Thelohanellus kitauei]